MAVTLRYELNGRPKEDGTHLILLRITVSRKLLRIGTGNFVLASHWNAKANDKLENWIKRQADDHLLIKTSLRNKYRNAQAAMIRMEEDGVEQTAENAKDYVQRAWSGDLSAAPAAIQLLEFIQSQIEICGSSGVEELAVKYRTMSNELLDHMKGDVPITSINLEFLHRYEAFLLGKNERTTILKKMHFLRGLLKKAVDYGHLKNWINPFDQYTFKAPRVHKESLTPEEMRQIIDLELDPHLTRYHARNIFCLQYYCAGSRIGDMLMMRWLNVQGDRLVFIMSKGRAKKARNIKLSPDAMRILEIYRKPGCRDQDFIFPFVKNGIDVERLMNSSRMKRTILGGPTANINTSLKEVAHLAGIAKNVSTHIARHSFARHALKATGDVYLVSKALGHSNLQITENYLESLDQGAVDAAINITFA